MENGEDISPSVVIMPLFSTLLSPNQIKTTNSSPLSRWALIHSWAIRQPWLDSVSPPNELLPAAAVAAEVTMETVVIVAIGVLATIFLASFIALVVVCRHRYCRPHDLLHHFDSKSVNQCRSPTFHAATVLWGLSWRIVRTVFSSVTCASGFSTAFLLRVKCQHDNIPPVYSLLS